MKTYSIDESKLYMIKYSGFRKGNRRMKKSKAFILKGNIIYADTDKTVHYEPNAYLICAGQQSAGVFQTLPQQYANLPVTDYGDKIIIPGMSDLHLHAPQYSFRGFGMDLELIAWLNTITFPEESKYSNLAYAKEAYEIFVDDLKHSTTTRACIFATLHAEATLLLMDMLEKSGLKTYVGKVNMDRNSCETLCEESPAKAYADTKRWIEQALFAYTNTKPILTPRFIPSCTDELMKNIALLQKEYQLPVQSHLSENLSEIAWVKELVPASSCYGDAYRMFGLFGQAVPTIMAHCVYSSEEEVTLMKENGVYVAHCPESNINLSSGIAPIRSYMEKGLHVGLGSDLAAGSSISLFTAMAYAIQASKMYYRLQDQTAKALSFEDVFYLATLGGGEFFGKVGSFLPSYEFDAVVLDDTAIRSARTLSLKERMERLLYQHEKCVISAKYVSGIRCL